MRPAARRDLMDFIRLRRTLGCEETGPGMVPQDVPAEVSAIHAAAISAKYSGGAGTPDCKDTSDMEWITRVMQASGKWDGARTFRTYALVKSGGQWRIAAVRSMVPTAVGSTPAR